MSEKICEGCLKKVEFYTVDREQDYSETFLEPPPEQHPELDKLVTIKIENSKFKNRKIYYFAAKHCSKFNLPEKTNLCENNRSTFYSKLLVDPESRISYEEPSPNRFSFNSISCLFK